MALFLVSFTSFASVTMMGTRIIYPSNASSVELRFQSQDDFPSIMEVWTHLHQDSASKDDENNGETPFIAVPPVFRIDANKGQIIKLSFTGEDLPKDRESLFYFSSLQVPAMKANQQDNNLLTVTFKNTVKVFFRPKELKETPDASFSKLQVGVVGQNIKISNPTGYYYSLTELKFKQDGQERGKLDTKDGIKMLPPFSETVFPLKNIVVTPGKTIVSIHTINDLGGISVADFPL